MGSVWNNEMWTSLEDGLVGVGVREENNDRKGKKKKGREEKT